MLYLKFIWLLLFSYLNLNLYTSFLDFFSRTNFSDFFLNNYFYFWTTFWYIPTIFILTLTVLILYFFLKLGCITTWASVFFILSLTNFELLDYWYTNPTYSYIFISNELVNPLLTNSINKYHPFIFYTVVITYTINYYKHYTDSTSGTTNVFRVNMGYFFLKKYKHYLSIMITYTLFLGSWWALQEGSWGGWWNWDPSEMFGFLVLIIVMVSFHHTINLSKYYLYVFSSFIWLLVLLSLYVFIQLNFSLVSHNFGIKSSQFINGNQLLLLVYLLVFGNLIWIFTQIYLYYTSFLLNQQYVITGYVRPVLNLYLVLFLLILFQFLYSFYPLFNDFLWKLFTVNTLNNYLSIYSLVLYVNTGLLLFYVSYFNFGIVLLTVICMRVGFDYYIPVLFLPLVFITRLGLLKRTYILHLLLFIFTFTSVLKLREVFTHWSVSYHTHPHTVNYLINSVFDSLRLVIDLSTLDKFTTPLTNYTFMVKSTSPDNATFATFGNILETNQELVNSFFNKLFFIKVSDPSPILLLTISVLVYLTLVSYVRQRLLIIF